VRSRPQTKERKNQMHDLIIAATFIAMVIAPCFVALNSGKELDNEA
jgi:hypothetical protein